jgi:two-component system heavy metal sensor histidine kinase CusS
VAVVIPSTQAVKMALVIDGSLGRASRAFASMIAASSEDFLSGKLFRTLRFRLTLWNSIVVLIAALLALLALRIAMRVTIENEARALLREELTELEFAIKEFHPDRSKINEEFERKILSHAQHGWFAALFEGEQTLWESNNFPAESWEAAAIFSSPDFAFTRTNNMLLVVHRLTTSDGEQQTIILGEPTEFIRNDIWQLTKTILLIGVGLVLIAPVGGYFLARHATQPVRQIIATTRSLNPAHLDSRLEIRGSGDELDQISAEINSFVSQISKYINSQKAFVANAAHELRSPITAIQTSVEVTLDKQRTVAEYQEELVVVSEQCQQLRHLVNQLLELAESDALLEKVDFQAVNLSKVVETSISVFSGVAEDRGTEIVPHLEPEVIVEGDESKLRQVVNNLLDNALKFGSADGSVKIELVDRGDAARLVIQDSGPGVPEDQLERIFERFFQVDQSRQRTTRQGSGLGLSICKSIIALHQGTIEAKNLETGFAIEVRLPRIRH